MESNKILQRLKEFTDEICETEEDVLIVAHAGSINGMISNLTGEPFDKLLKNFGKKLVMDHFTFKKRIKAIYNKIYWK